jgi:drug/metabolite transporter (DMT)-like permease
LKAGLKDYVQLHFIIILWGFTAILGLLIRIPAVELVFFRTMLASFGLLIVILFTRRNFNVRFSDFLKLSGTGVIIAGHWMLFFESARFSTASVCLAGMATTSFWTSLIEPLFKSKSIQMLEVFFGLVVIAGLYLIFHFEFNYAFGLALSLGSAFLGAVFTVVNSKITHHHDEYVISFYEMTTACLTTGILLMIYFHQAGSNVKINLDPSGMDWFYLALLAFVCTVYPFSVAIELMKRISAFTMNLSVNLEPVYGIILAVIIFGDKEKMNTGFYLGTLIILASVIGYPLIRNQVNKRKMMKLGTGNSRAADDGLMS